MANFDKPLALSGKSMFIRLELASFKIGREGKKSALHESGRASPDKITA
jgi:hypothetical protein